MTKEISQKTLLREIKYLKARQESCDGKIETHKERIRREEEKKNGLQEKISYLTGQLK